MGSSAIVSAWNTAVFQHATIQAITTKTYQFDVSATIRSTPEFELFFYNQQVNFFQQTVTRLSKNDEIRGTGASASRYEYDVEVSYFLERDISQTDDNYNTAINRIEILDNLVRAQLGSTWSSTVDYWTVSGILKPQLITLEDRDVWRCGYSYLAIEQS